MIDRDKCIALIRQLNRDINWIKQSGALSRSEEPFVEWLEGVKYYYKFFKYDWDEKEFVAVLEPAEPKNAENVQLEWKTMYIVPALEQLQIHAKKFRTYCIMMDVDTYMHAYVLTFPYDQDPALKMHLETMITEINEWLEKLADYGDFPNEEEIIDLPSGGLHYQVLEIIPGVKRVHKHSEAAATAVCQQVPSADEYEFEVTQEWIEQFLATLRKAVTRLGMKRNG
jgi:hypothetical protein